MSHSTNIYAIINSSNPAESLAITIDTVLKFVFGDINITYDNTEFSVNNRLVNLIDIQNRAENRMTSCFDQSRYYYQHDQTFCIGIEHGLISGLDTDKHSERNWYDVCVCAVTVFKGGSFFKYTSCIMNPVLMTNVDSIDAVYSLSPDVTKPDVIVDTFSDVLTKLNNIHTFEQLGHNITKVEIDTVIMFGTFDLFHDLHKRLIDHAYLVGKRLVIYIYHKSYKYKQDTKTIFSDSVKQRMTNVVQYTLQKHRSIDVYRMCQSHSLQLQQSILTYSSQGLLAVMGGDDQFNDHQNIVKICSDFKVPIISLNRGETKLKLCSSDIREKLSYTRIMDAYGIDPRNISPFFWKQRITSLDDAKTYIATKLKFLGLDQAELWKILPSKKIDKRVISITSNKNIPKKKRIVLCLPGRTTSAADRFRKIGLTIKKDFLPEYLHDSTSIYVACYDQNNYDTSYHCFQLEKDPNYFSDDAMIFTKLLIMPIILRELDIGVIIDKLEDVWTITRVPQISVQTSTLTLDDITIFARSVGSVIALEMENAFKYCMIALGFEEDYIIKAANRISVLSMSNLASLTRLRLFRTVSITGINDRKASKFLDLPSITMTTADLNITEIDQIHTYVLALIPDKITEIGSNLIITDANCHYTPLFTAFRQNDSNVLPNYIRSTFVNMVERV